MATQRFFGNPHFLFYLRLLRRLHQLIRKGAGETEEGEALRERMDEVGEYLTQEEVDFVKGISIDFYTINTVPGIQANPPANLREVLSKHLAARDAQDYSKALGLLRKIEVYLEPALVAYFRGRIWSEAGEIEIAVDFFQRAKNLAPQNGNYAAIWLEALSGVNADEALTIAKDFLQQAENQPPPVILKAAEIVYTTTRKLPRDEEQAAIRELVPVFEDVVLRLEMSGEVEFSSSLLPSAIGLLGLCHGRLGEVEKAGEVFDKGLHFFPNDEVLLIARGIHRYEVAPENSRKDFQQAIRLGSRHPWPFFFLAHYYLLHSQYVECLEMAQAGLPLAQSDAIRSECLEWIAVCQANLGYPPEIVRQVFHAAHELAPANPRIAKNRQLFEESVSGIPPSQIAWEQPARETVQSLGQRELQPIA